jgi:3-oxoacyl-[acyl-carrier protein] reductase
MNVLVTGGSKGIGKSIVLELLKNDSINKVYITSRNTENLDVNSPKIIKINLDYLNPNWSEEILYKIAQEPIHVLINNSGYLYNGSVEKTSSDEITKMVTINYTGPFKLVQTLLNNLKLGKAHIINIGSMGGFQGSSKFPGLSIYSSSKAAFASLSECWAEEFKEFGIKSNCLALGAIDTEMLQDAFPGYKASISPTEVATSIVDFSLNYSGVMNGKVIPLSESTP